MHGALHGAWCWERLIPELDRLGHEALAIDLPGHGRRRSEVATLESYSEAVAEVVQQDDVLVGHSMGGTVIALAADLLGERVGHFVFLASPVPSEGQSLADLTPAFSGIPGLEFSDSEFWMMDASAVAEAFYHDCPREVREWGFKRLQPQSITPIVTPVHLKSWSTSKVPRSFIACLDDRTPALMAVEASVARLGLRVAYPLWASHSPFMSRPRDLASLLAVIVDEDRRGLSNRAHG